MKNINRPKPSEILSNILPKRSNLIELYIRIIWPKIDRIVAAEKIEVWEKILVGLTGNRLSAASYGFAIAMISSWDALNTFCGIILLVSSLPALSWFSIWTLDTYIRSLDHIEKYHNIDERFFLTLVKRDSHKKISWYCELQWMFLAAKCLSKEYPKWLESFLRFKELHSSNTVPNF